MEPEDTRVVRVTGKVFPRTLPDGSRNEWWPLPPDYADLSVDGRRKARLNACSLQQTPELAVHAWNYFCTYYLRDHPTSGFYSGFYETWLPFAPIHRSMVLWFEKFMLTAMAFPRGGGKTTTIRSYVLFKLATNRQFFANLYLSKYKPFVPETMDVIKYQLGDNERIVDDFSRHPHFGGQILPNRGKGLQSAEILRLTSLSMFRLWALDGQCRGARTHFSCADDVEKDPEDEHPTPEKQAKISRKIRKVILPTIKKGGRFALTGTLVHQGSFLNHVLTCDRKGSGDYDEKFLAVENGGHWKKCNLGAMVDSQGQSVWPEMWGPADIARQKSTMGLSAWMAEFGGQPVSEEEPLFHLNDKDHWYDVLDHDEALVNSPFRSRAKVRWNECSGAHDALDHTEQVKPWAEWLAGLMRGITVDPASGLTASHDPSCIHVGGMNDTNNLYSLDIWQGRATDAQVISKVWELAIKWRVQVIGIEAVGLQEHFFHAAQQHADRMFEACGFIPQMVPIKHGTLSKGMRIKRLEWRYNFGKVKYPAWRKREDGYRELIHQTAFFTEDLANLKHDDAIDSTEMLQTLFKGQRAAAPAPLPPDTPVNRLLAGRLHDDLTGLPNAAYLNLNRLDPTLLNQLMQRVREDTLEERAGDQPRWEPLRSLVWEPPLQEYLSVLD